MPVDMFEATSQVARAICTFKSETVKEIILMALIARGLDDLLIDPNTIRMTSPQITTTPKKQNDSVRWQIMVNNDSLTMEVGNT